MFKIGDEVTRISYNNDIIFIIVDFKENIYYLKGKYVRLYVDAYEEDLKKSLEDDKDEDFEKRIYGIKNLDRNNYFYMPGKILHIDGDKDYLNKCLDYYKRNNLKAIGKLEKESDVANKIVDWLIKYKPNIVVITGHDAIYKKEKKYKNTENFLNSIRECRKHIRNQDELIIIAGACQSDYESLLCAGANFASSPKRINIHALDPAIIAASMAFSEANKEINLKEIIQRTKYGSDGIGGIITKGTMHVGYPR
jgi:spore coat assembly protein